MTKHQLHISKNCAQEIHVILSRETVDNAIMCKSSHETSRPGLTPTLSCHAKVQSKQTHVMQLSLLLVNTSQHDY